MENLKKLFPFSYKQANDLKQLLIAIVIYLVIGFVLGLVAGVLDIIPLIGGLLAWVVGTVGSVYGLVGIVLAVLRFCGVLKD